MFFAKHEPQTSVIYGEDKHDLETFKWNDSIHNIRNVTVRPKREQQDA